LLALLAATSSCASFFEQPTNPLHRAAWTGDVTAIRSLVAQGSDVNATDPQGLTALYWAARGGHPIGPHRCGGEDADRPAVLAALLDLGAHINAQDRRPRIPGGSSGWTPLFVALHHEQWTSATLLLERGANPNILSDQRLSAMEMASAEGAPRALIDVMLAKGFDPALTHRRGDR
jgi:ankyrin repeat protein